SRLEAGGADARLLVARRIDRRTTGDRHAAGRNEVRAPIRDVSRDWRAGRFAVRRSDRGVVHRPLSVVDPGHMTQSGYLFLGLTGIVAALAAVLAFAVLRFFEAGRAATRGSRMEGTETAFMAAAVEEAVGKLKSQGRAMQARAEASERLSSEIIASMTSGL